MTLSNWSTLHHTNDADIPAYAKGTMITKTHMHLCTCAHTHSHTYTHTYTHTHCSKSSKADALRTTITTQLFLRRNHDSFKKRETPWSWTEAKKQLSKPFLKKVSHVQNEIMKLTLAKIQVINIKPQCTDTGLHPSVSHNHSAPEPGTAHGKKRGNF